MFKNLKDLINTRQKLNVAKDRLVRLEKEQDFLIEDAKSYKAIIRQLNLDLERKEAQLSKIESIIANRRETLKGLNKKINPGLSTPKKAAPKKAVKKTK